MQVVEVIGSSEWIIELRSGIQDILIYVKIIERNQKYHTIERNLECFGFGYQIARVMRNNII